MKNLLFQTTMLIMTFVIFLYSCKLKKQTITNDKVVSQLTSRSSTEEQKSANLIERGVDSSKTVKKDSALISVTEKEDVEYDYSNPVAGSPAKVIRHIEKTSNFQTGSNTIVQKNVMLTETANLNSSEKGSDSKVTHIDKSQHTIFSIVSSSGSWIWVVGLILLLIAVGIYVIKRFNLISIAASFFSKII